MASTLSAPARPASRSLTLSAGPKPAEWVALAYFVYLAALSLLRQTPFATRIALVMVPLALWYLWRWESAKSRPWSRVLREWSSLGLILLGYWLLEVFSAPASIVVHAQWLSWDRLLLDGGLRAAIESTGSAIPAILESVYLCLYGIPALALGAIYLCGERRTSHRFLAVLLFGTFAAYALLPWRPVASPRVAIPEHDLPQYIGAARQFNMWLLDHLDISTSVFPSGHVAVAFSAAFGLVIAIPRRRAICTTAFAVASLVYVATIYGRYHYAIDGAVSFGIAAAAWQICQLWFADE